jgi:hypothetical protein
LQFKVEPPAIRMAASRLAGSPFDGLIGLT